MLLRCNRQKRCPLVDTSSRRRMDGVGEWEWRLENSKEVTKCRYPVIKASLMSTKRSKDLGFSI